MRRDRFTEVGGYREVGVMSDIDLWYRMSAKWQTVFLPPALCWWRQHEDQASNDSSANLDYIQGEFRITMDAMNKGTCPLKEPDRQSAIYRKKQHLARRLVKLGTRQRQPFLARRLAREAGLSFSELLGGLRRYQ